MTRAIFRRTLSICAVAVAVTLAAAPASAQTGQIKGKVVDAQGNPVDGAKVTIYNQQTNRPLETKTNKKGEYIQVGLAPGEYKVTVAKDALSVDKAVKISLDMAVHDFKLVAGGGATGSKEDIAKAKAKSELMNKTFNEGVTLSNEGKGDEAIAKFREIIAVIPNCPECYANIGTVQAQGKKYDEAEASYKKAIEVKPDFAEAYNGLANVYNAMKKFDLAAEASKKALELSAAAPGAPGSTGPAAPNASAVFNQGVILWNAGKIPDAKAQFEQAVKLDPNLADARYWLGMALVNAGTPEAMKEAKPHFEAYIKLAPTGANVETAKAIVATIK
jgi:tetratricopeptide (TPR) repeat protein